MSVQTAWDIRQLLKAMAVSWSDLWFGWRYVLSVWVHVAIVAAIGLAIGVMPTAFMTNWLGEAIALRVGDAPEDERNLPVYPDDWPADALSSAHQPSLFVYWSWTLAWMLMMAQLSPILVVVADRSSVGKSKAVRYVSGGCLALGASVMLAWQLSRMDTVFARVPRQTFRGVYLVLAVFSPVLIYRANSSLFATGASIAAALLMSIFKLAIHYLFVACHTHLLNHPSWILRALIRPSILTCVRSVCLEVVLRLTRRVQGIGVWGRSLEVIHMNSYCIGVYQVLQVTSSDHALVAVTYACMAGFEAWRNSTLLAGETEFDYYMRCLAQVWRYVWQKNSRVEPFSPVVPGPVAESPEGAPQEKEEDEEKVQILYEVVRASNVMESLAMLSITVLFFVAKVNPYEEAGDPLSRTCLLTTLALGLVFESLADFLTGMLGGSRLSPRREQSRDILMRWTFCVSSVMLIACMVSLLSVMTHLCPTPGDSGMLRALSPCPYEHS